MHVVFHELLVGEGRSVRKGQAFEMLGDQSIFNASAKTFLHNNEEERGERVSLFDFLGRLERRGGDAINQNREEGGRNET